MLLEDCQRLTELATDYHEGTMTLWQRLNYYVHVAMCPPCRNFREQMRMTAEAARTTELKESSRTAAVEAELEAMKPSLTPSQEMLSKLEELRKASGGED